jgi:hypothetical protein
MIIVNKDEIKVPDYIMDSMEMGWAISKTPVEMNEEHAKNIIGLLVLNDDSDDSLLQKTFDAYEFIREIGNYDYFYGVKNFEELAEIIVAYDTENNNEGYRESLFGNLPKEWAKHIDTKKLAQELERSGKVTFNPEWNAAIRKW